MGTEWELTAIERDGRPSAVIVRAGPAATVADLRRALDEAGYAEPLAGFADHLPLSNMDLVSGGGFHGWRARPSGAGRELAAVGGRGAGVTASLTRTVAIGRSPECGLRLVDPEVSRVHATVTAEGSLADAGSRNGVVWRGFRLAGPAELDPEDVFGVGETVVTLRHVDPADAPIEPPSGDGVLRYNRPPRIPTPTPTVELSAPAKPDKPRGVRIPILAALLPLVIGAVVWSVFPGAGYFIIFLALSPLLLIAHFINDKRSGRREYRDALKEYESRHAAIAADLEELARTQGKQDRRAEPDPAYVRRIATGPTRRLFERRPDDPDFLRLRVGSAAARSPRASAVRVLPMSLCRKYHTRHPLWIFHASVS